MTSLLLLTAAMAAFANEIEHTPGFAIRGLADDNIGSNVHSAGDVDGDGIDDIIADGYRSSTQSMVAVVYSGANRRVLHEVEHAAFSVLPTYSVDGVGDLDGDGHGEFIVGFPERESAVVYSGADGSVRFTLQGRPGPAAFGGTVAGGGDADGDGVPDVIVGTDRRGSVNRPGYVRVYSGATGDLLHNFEGRRPTVGFGGAIADAGDCNGDGYADIVIGSESDGTDFLFVPPITGFGPLRQVDRSGAVYVYSGADGTLLHRLLGADEDERLGFTVAGAGDVDGDGRDDVIAGTEFPEFPRFGVATVFSGATGQVLHTFLGQEAAEGVSVDGVGDLDLDGFDDLLVGSRLSNFGEPAVKVYSGATGEVLFAAADIPGFDNYHSVSRAGDLNGDGVGDFLVGVTLELSFPGVIFTYVSKPGPGLAYCVSTPNSTGGAAAMVTTGSASLVANDLRLAARPVPNTLGRFIYGAAQAQTPIGGGFLCVGGQSAFLPPTVAVGNTLSQPLDATMPPDPALTITAGSTWNFQAWFLDPNGGGAGRNLSDGLEVTFVP
ncbi:MAG: FG-GAP-like repeat-containing protein [Planctomycetota bacterium]